MNITQQEVEIYRDIYYEYLKPHLKKTNRIGCGWDEVEEVILPVVLTHGWTMEKFRTFHTIDLMQRIAYTTDVERMKGGNPKVKMMAGDQQLDYANSYHLWPELRCPFRSEEKRNLN